MTTAEAASKKEFEEARILGLEALSRVCETIEGLASRVADARRAPIQSEMREAA